MALKLTRKLGQEIYIAGDQVKIKVERIRGNRVILEIEAPEDISINRKEVYDRGQGKVDKV